MSERPSVAVAIPAYNEAEGIGGFLAEIDAALAPSVSWLRMVVVDDCSTDATASVAEAFAGHLTTTVEVVRSPVNRGHGPTLLAAYRAALASRADLVLQVDGDGQFLGTDLRRVKVLLEDGADCVCGVRRFRFDPWFRMGMTRLVRLLLDFGFGVPTRDANCPLRGYHAHVLADLLPWIPADCLVPNLFLTVLAARHGVTMVEVDVNHRVRRGGSAQGTMWTGARHIPIAPIPSRLVKFSARAFMASLAFRRSMNSGRRPARSAADGD